MVGHPLPRFDHRDFSGTKALDLSHNPLGPVGIRSLIRLLVYEEPGDSGDEELVALDGMNMDEPPILRRLICEHIGVELPILWRYGGCV